MIYVILGTKGQFMKMFPIMKLFDQEKVPYRFIHTSQHYGIIEDNRKRLGVRKPDVYLTGKKKDLRNIGEMLWWIPQVLWNARKLPITKNDYVLTHGDAESTLLSFLIAKYFGAKQAHVEAGMRSGNYLEPFPEEAIRVFVDRFSDVCFCPQKEDVKNIHGSATAVVTNGNTVFDSVRLALEVPPAKEVIKLFNKKYVLFLIHRKENLFTKNRVVSILDILETILKKGYVVVWPMHTNTKYELQKKGVWERIESLKKKFPLTISYFLDYIDFMHAVKHSAFVASDGGGLQKETYFMNKPMLILRMKTEPEPGVGETAFLSMLSAEKVDYFLNNLSTFTRKKAPAGSPSKIIADFFKRHQT